MTDTTTKLVNALEQLMEGCEWRCIQGDWAWHRKAMPSNAALTAAREVLAAHRVEQQAVGIEMPAPDLRGVDVATLSEWRMLRASPDTSMLAEADLPKIIERACETYGAACEATGYRRGLEAAAAVCRTKAERIRAGRKRVPQVDEHTATVLDGGADAICALKGTP